MTLLLRNARLANGQTVDVTIAGGMITEVTSGPTPTTDAEVVDLAGALLLPAFVEPHAHLDKALSAERAPNPAGDLAGAIEAWTAYAPQLTVADMAERAERCALVLLANGVTLIRSHADIHEGVGLRAVEALVLARERLAGQVDLEITGLPKWPTTGAAGATQRDRLREAIAIGIDHVGGCPHLEPEGPEAIDVALELAGEHGLGVDLHVDETLDVGTLTLETLAERVIATGFDRPVLAGHCVSLGVQPEDVQRRVAAKVAAAGISVTALPQTNLYLQSRGLACAPPRGLTAVAALRAAGVNVAAGGDNVQDPFNVVGRADPLETAALLVMAGHLTPDDALAAVSDAARRALAAPEVGVVVGSPAELVAIDAGSVREAVASASPSRLVVHRGVVVASRSVVEGWRPGRSGRDPGQE